MNRASDTSAHRSPHAACIAILDAVETAVVGKRPQLELLLAAVLARGHILLDDLPGLGKTLIARSMAQATGVSLGRVQFTPDLMPADITGSVVLDRESGAFGFRPGPIFANLVIGDEINRAPPKTQAALLEAMQERQVTVDRTSHPLPDPFIVIATQNPVDSEGTYPLPEAQVDRFLIRTRLGYPTRDDDLEIMRRRLTRQSDTIAVTSVVGPDDLVALQGHVETVTVEESILGYCVDLVHATRQLAQVDAGASPRGVEALVKLARGVAVISGREFVTPDDVKRVAVPALAHRLVLSAEAWVRNTSAESLITELLTSVATPPTIAT